ncbi:putative E3 ubiquitin-protein ligase [Actinomortierella wolfii]|nr:putative E3 ubiquitin-protein ligase [Actinomortierella wolfii]
MNSQGHPSPYSSYRPTPAPGYLPSTLATTQQFTPPSRPSSAASHDSTHSQGAHTPVSSTATMYHQHHQHPQTYQPLPGVVGAGQTPYFSPPPVVSSSSSSPQLHTTFMAPQQTYTSPAPYQSHSAYQPPPPTTTSLSASASASTMPLQHPLQQPSTPPQLTPPQTQSSPAIPASDHLIIGKCLYCKSQLCYPQSVKVFQCVTCDTINDLIPAPGTVPAQPLTISMVETTIYNCKRATIGLEEPSYQPLDALLAEHLTKFAAFNACFSTGRPITYEHCGVNLDDARTAFGQLSRLLPWLTRQRTPDEAEYHHNITKRLFTIISNLPSELHRYLRYWFAALPISIFRSRINFVNKFITYRLSRQQQSDDRHQHIAYQTDPPIQAAARVMQIFFKANQPDERLNNQGNPDIYGKRRARDNYVIIPRNQKPTLNPQKVPIDEFYNMLVDVISLPLDFMAWESRSTTRFSFCQYPFLISMGAKTQIMGWDAKRQMEIKMQKTLEALINEKRQKVAEAIQNGDTSMMLGNVATLLTPQELQRAPLLILRVNRNNLIEDSLRQLSMHDSDLKKSLRIEFVGEDGIDAGGLRKEWFLLLVRQLFDPQYGMFVYDDQSNYCWFNPASFESLDQYYLVGVVIGLSIYNSTILDLPLPLAVYKKLLHSPMTSAPLTLHDLATFRPDLARGFEQLLLYEGEDVEDVFCLTFVGSYEAYGEVKEVPLIPNGENIPVTHLNKYEYVERYCNFIINTSIEEQFESFRRGFYLVCGGHALSLFRPEEIESLVRGSAEPLDLDQLRSVTVYEGFHDQNEVIQNFWSIFKEFDDRDQRRLLQFITASDRYPATGIANLHFKITCIGSQDSDRFPTSHTCFNQLCLYNYKGREKLKRMLIRAMNESEGFGVK